ncbi:MAG: hypothetical protein R2788_17010 [Saprospiraceae bacterium]
MELRDIRNPVFRGSGIEILKNNGELLILIRYPFGDKDFILLKSKEEFFSFLENRNEKESITLLRSFHAILRGVVDEDFVAKLMEKAVGLKPLQWVSIGKPKDVGDLDNWGFIGDINELQEQLEDAFGRDICILEEPDWFDEELVFHAYVPDKDGIVRLGAY